MDEQDFVNVAIRIKPVIENQKENSNYCLNVISQEPAVLVMLDRGQTFYFDNIFTDDNSQEMIFQKSVKPLVKHVKAGYNCTVFAYGQTGTGKTYTIGTDPQGKISAPGTDVSKAEPVPKPLSEGSSLLSHIEYSLVTDSDSLGLIPRTLNEFFQYTIDDDNSEIEIFVSFIEIYNEKVFDLLQNNSQPPLLVKGLRAHGFCQEKVFNLYEARHFLEMGNKNRHTAETKQNAKSSRSHAIFTIYCNVRHETHETTAKINLVDLAGSESVKKTGNRGSTFHEGVNINKGLLSISQVMTALSTNSSFIPYRQSIITSILQDSLNKRNFVSLIACISPLQDDSTETLQTLDFAQRVKKVKSKPEVNEVIAQYKKDNPNMFHQTRLGNTPFKRPADIYQTPNVTKRNRPLAPIIELSRDVSEQSQSVQSLSLSRMSSVSSSSSISQQTLSPVIKKYMSAMESSLMDKMEIMIKSTLKQPRREADIKETNERTPSVVWNSIQNQVSKLIKTEIAQLTSRPAKVTSSPIEEIDQIRKVLKYDNSFERDEHDTLLQSTNSEDEITVAEFKIPSLSVVRKKVRPKRTLSISPIQNEPAKVRRSVRLSMKKIVENNSLDDFDVSSSYLDFGKTNQEDKTREETFKNNEIILDNFNSTLKRRSIRLTKKRPGTTLTVGDTPAGKRLKKLKRKDSPCTLHTKQVLNLLNTGTLKQLEKLQSVGPKTAQQIVLFRDLKGHLKKISDLSQMPGWSGKRFEKFIDQNFLKKDIIF